MRRLLVLLSLALLAPSASAQRLGVPEAAGLVFASIVAGRDFTCGLTADGEAHCWGANYYGQLGHRETVAACRDAELEDAPCAPTAMPVSGELRFTALSAAEHHVCGLTAGGDAWCWGTDHWGQLGPNGRVDECLVSRREFRGIPAEPCSHEPVLVPSDRPFTTLAAGGEATCALDIDGGVWCWGGMPFDTDPPRRLEIAESFASLRAGGAEKLCAITADARLRCWNRKAMEWEGVDAPMGDMRVSDVAVGPFHTCALDADGRAHCWGSNENGEGGVGYAGKGQYIGPATLVAGGRRFRAIYAAHERTCAIDASAALHCWGWLPEIRQRDICAHRDYSASRTFPRGCSTRPRRLLAGTRVAAVALGPTHRCALSTRGSVSCWGSNAWGALGDGTFADAGAPTSPGGEAASLPLVVAAAVRGLVGEVLLRAGAALLAFVMLLRRARPWMASRSRDDVWKLWAVAIALVIGLRLVYSVTRPLAIGEIVDGLIFQPLVLAALGTGYRLLVRWRAGALAPVGPSPSVADAEAARRLGWIALGSVIAGWVPMLSIWLDPSPPSGGGDVALGLAWLAIFVAGGIMAVGATGAVVMATIARRRATNVLAANAALGLSILTGAALSVAVLWLRYFA